MIIKSQFFLLVSILLIIFITFITIITMSCDKTNTQVTDASETVSVINQNALITFIDGDTYLLLEEEWEPVDIGYSLKPGSTIKTDLSSYCDIQFGNAAVVRINEDTEINISDIQFNESSSNITLDMVKGSVLCKVSKLSGYDSFNVGTENAVCGVRGTEFLVRTNSEETILAVKEGSVAIIPGSVNITTLKKIIKEEEIDETGEILAALEKIEESSVLVSKHQEISISSKTLGEENNLDVVSVIIEEIILEKEVTPEKMESLNTSVNNLVKILGSLDSKPENISEENLKDLENTENMIIQDFSETTTEQTTVIENIEEPENKTIEDNSIIINVTPEKAEILRGDEIVGIGTYTYDITYEKELEFSFRLDDHEPQTLNIDIQDNKKEYFVTLTEIIKHIENKFTVSSAGIIRRMNVIKNRIIIADSLGVLTAADFKGNKIWSLTTKNSPNENSYPVVINNKVYFTGASEFILADANTGSNPIRIDLDDEFAHFFGRRIVAFNNKCLLPGNDFIKIISSGNGSMEKEIPILAGSRMTPAVYNNMIFIMNQDGVFLKINPDSGEVISQISTTLDQPVALSVTFYNDLAFLAGRKGKVACLSLSAENLKWETQLTGGSQLIVYQDLVCSSSIVYIYTRGKIHALFISNGEYAFNPIENVSSPPLYNNGKIYYGVKGGALHIASGNSGIVQKSLILDEVISARPALYNDRILCGTETGAVFIINPEAIN